MSKDDKKVIDEHVEDIMLSMKEAYRRGIDGYYRDMLLTSRPWQLTLDKIAVPVFMWHGTEDRQVPISSARKFSKMIPDCEIHFVPNAGHMLLANNKKVRLQMMNRILSVED